MAGYPKIWTTLLDEPWFVRLSLNAKSVFLQLILHAKKQGDTGFLVFKSWAALAEELGGDRVTVTRIVRDFHQQGKVLVFTDRSRNVHELFTDCSPNVQSLWKNQRQRFIGAVEKSTGLLCLYLPKYQEYQDLKSLKQKRQNHKNVHALSKNRHQANPTEPYRTLQNPTEPKENRPDQANRLKSNLDDLLVGQVRKAFFNKFRQDLDGNNLERLLNGRDGYPGYGNCSILLFAITNIQLGKEQIKNPVGLLLTARRESGRYFDHVYDEWKRLQRLKGEV